jgi:hypothetical protein
MWAFQTDEPRASELSAEAIDVDADRTTFVFAGSVAGGVAVNTTFLDFPDQGKCQKAAAAMNTSERVDIGGARAGRPSISPPAYYQIVARCVER